VALGSPPIGSSTTKRRNVAHKAFDFAKSEGHGPGSTFRFRDNIPGPSAIDFAPGQAEPIYSETPPQKAIEIETE
jgi:hypothetical protein